MSVLLCELGERIIAFREVLAEPAIAAKPHARAVAALLAQGLDAVEARLQRDVFGRGQDDAALHAVAACSQGLRVLHRRLGLLDRRWSAAPVDIFLRKLRDDIGDLPHPAVVLSDDYAALDHDVAERLRTALDETGLPLPPTALTGSAVVALPYLEAANPLSWPLLLPALARLYLEEQGWTLDARACDAAVARLGGPAAFAARSAFALAFTPPTTPLWPMLAPLADAAAAWAGGLDDRAIPDRGFAAAGLLDLFTRLLRARGHALDHNGAPPERAPYVDLALPAPALPTAAETVALLAKLVAGTPINAVEPPIPPDFVARLDAVDDPTAFYALIEPLGERPASLAAILGVGWLYKVRHGYTLFRDLMESEGALGPALAAYRPHMVERDELLLQSIEAAHVQGIFVRGRLDG